MHIKVSAALLWVQIITLSCVTFRKLINVPLPQFLPVETADIITLSTLCAELNIK